MIESDTKFCAGKNYRSNNEFKIIDEFKNFIVDSNSSLDHAHANNISVDSKIVSCLLSTFLTSNSHNQRRHGHQVKSRNVQKNKKPRK